MIFMKGEYTLMCHGVGDAVLDFFVQFVLQILQCKILNSSFAPTVCILTFMNWGVWLGVKRLLGQWSNPVIKMLAYYLWKETVSLKLIYKRGMWQ